MTTTTEPTSTTIQRKIIEQVINRLPYLTSGSVYTAAAILGEKFWEEDNDSHRSIGKSFSHLVSKGRLPFEVIGLTPVRHNEYRYTPEE